MIHATGSAWHACAQAVCNLVASVTADMHEINESLRMCTVPPSSEEPVKPDRAKFMALSGVMAAIATVMHRHPSPSYALASEPIGQQINLLLSFCNACLSSKLPPQPAGGGLGSGAARGSKKGPTDASGTSPRSRSSYPGLPAIALFCTQHAAVWLGLLQRAAQPRAVAKVLEASVPLACMSLHDMIPTSVPDSWLQVQHDTQHGSSTLARSAEEPSRTFAVAASSPDTAAVDDMVQQAFQNVLKKHVGEQTTQVHGPQAASLQQQAAKMDEDLPLWVVLLMHVSLILDADCISGSNSHMLPLQGAGADILETKRQMHAAARTATQVQTHDQNLTVFLKQLAYSRFAAVPAAWGLLSVLVPMLEPIAPFCASVKVLELEASAEPSRGDAAEVTLGSKSSMAKELGWAAQIWRMHLRMSHRVLSGADGERAEASRGIAGYVLNLVTHRAGQAAIRSVCDFIMDAQLTLAQTSFQRQEQARNKLYENTARGAADCSVCDAPISEEQETHARFQFIFGVHLLQTALRRPQIPVSALLAIVEELGSMTQRICGHAQQSASSADRTPVEGANIEGDTDTDYAASLEDTVQILVISMSAISLAMQTTLSAQQRVHACTTRLLSAAAVTLREALSHLTADSKAGNPDTTAQNPQDEAEASRRTEAPVATSSASHAAGSSGESVSAAAVSAVPTLCNIIQQTLPMVLVDSHAAVSVVSVSVQALISTACSLPASKDTTSADLLSSVAAAKEAEGISVTGNVGNSPEASGRDKAASTGTSGSNSVGTTLLSSAVGLMSSLVNSPTADAPQVMQAVLLCFATLTVPTDKLAKKQITAILQRVPAWSPSLLRKPTATGIAQSARTESSQQQEKHPKTARIRRNVESPLTLQSAEVSLAQFSASNRVRMSAVQQEQDNVVPMGAATALLEAMLRGRGAARKVLVAPSTVSS